MKILVQRTKQRNKKEQKDKDKITLKIREFIGRNKFGQE
jgi:hypothetical protein